MNAPQSILVINVTRIGDTLLAVPALRALAEHWPQARLTVLGHPKRVEVLQNLPFLAEVGGITKAQAAWRGWLPGKTHDLALVYGHDTALINYALRCARQVVAFRQSSERINTRLYRVVEPAEPGREHAVDQALRLPAALGIQATSRRLQFALSKTERAEALAAYAAHGLAERHPRIGLQIASFPTKAYRDWPEDSFVELCLQVLQAFPEACFLLFGGPDDLSRVERVCRRIGRAAINLAGLPLRPTAALMAGLDAYVGVDTGPTHIMGCFDVPLVGLYHCRLPRRLYGALDHHLDFSLDHPRLAEGGDETTPMAEIGVASVFQQLCAALKAGAATRVMAQEFTSERKK